MSDAWEDWEDLPPAATPTGSKLKGPGINAKSRVLTNGQTNLWLYLNGALTEAFGGALKARLRVSSGGEDTLPMVRLDLGVGDTPITLIATRGPGGRAGSRLKVSAPRWLPSIEKGPIALQIVAQDAAGVTLAFDLEAWRAPEPARAKPPASIARPPAEVAALHAAAAAQMNTPGLGAAKPHPLAIAPGAPANAMTITGKALTTILTRAGYQAERVSDEEWDVDGERKTAAEVVDAVNAFRAGHGEGPIRLARA